MWYDVPENEKENEKRGNNMMYYCLKKDFPKVEKRINRISKTMDKYGFEYKFQFVKDDVLELPVYEIDQDGVTKIQTGTTFAEVSYYEFFMETIKIGNYTPVAILKHNYDGNTTNNTVTLIDNQLKGNDAPACWWTVDGFCDDCKDKYKRQTTIILLDNDTDEYKQVGTSCVKKYTGIDCRDIISVYGDVTEFVNQDIYVDNKYLADYSVNVRLTRDYLASCISLIKSEGYVKFSTNYDETTKIKGYHNKDKVSQECYDIADDVINYFSSLDINNIDDFARNVKSKLANKYSSVSGFVAYAYVLYKKLNEKANEQHSNSNSNYVGEIGEKIAFDGTVVKSISTVSNYGQLYINIFKDNNGNVFVWKTTTKSFDSDIKVQVSGTIKDHKEYNGQKQTILTRAKVHII